MLIIVNVNTVSRPAKCLTSNSPYDRCLLFLQRTMGTSTSKDDGKAGDPEVLTKEIVRRALDEDTGYGVGEDVTTNSTVPEDVNVEARSIFHTVVVVFIVIVFVIDP